jgi:hypothetical protein
MPINMAAFEAPAEDISKRLAKQIVEGRSREDLLKLAGVVMRQRSQEEQKEGAPGEPKTPDELWNYIVDESATFGAVEEQAKRVYSAFKTFVNRDNIQGEPRISETNYKRVGDMPYGSKVEVLGGTVAAVNGPHPQKAHSDEVEIMRADTWRESRNLASAKTTPDGRHITAQNYATSTMKWKGGRVWQILESFKRAKEKAIERFGDDKALVDDLITKTTTFYVLIWCIFEVAEQVPNCREAPENAHLPEWEPGLERSECKCDCNDIVNGTLEQQDDDGQPLPRTLASECQGRFYRSRGHRTRAEVIQLFLQNDERTWAAQQLCRETETEGLYIPQFSRQRHGLSRFPLDVANGPIYSGTDWGFTDEAAVLWIQYLERPVEAVRYDGTVIVVPRGARVALSELTIAQKTATELGQLAILREIKMANVLSAPRVQIRKRWADLQGAGDRRDWAKMGLKTARYSTRNFDEHVKEWRGIVDADRFFVVVDEDRFTGMGCPMLCEQIEGWREEDGKESRELPQHVVSAGRYVVYGMHDIYMDSGAQSPEQVEAQRMQQGSGQAPAAVPYGNSARESTVSMMGFDENQLRRNELAAESTWRAAV